MVKWLPLVETPNKICDKCLISKQSRNSFSNHTTSKASEVLDVVYYDVCGSFNTPSLGGMVNLYPFLMAWARIYGYT